MSIFNAAEKAVEDAKRADRKIITYACKNLKATLYSQLRWPRPFFITLCDPEMMKLNWHWAQEKTTMFPLHRWSQAMEIGSSHRSNSCTGSRKGNTATWYGNSRRPSGLRQIAKLLTKGGWGPKGPTPLWQVIVVPIAPIQRLWVLLLDTRDVRSEVSGSKQHDWRARLQH